MKKNRIIQKIEGYKEKLVNCQCRLAQIEKKVQYKDIDSFGMYKPLIETEFDKLELMISGLEANIESIQYLISGGCAFCGLSDLDIEKMLTEQLQYSEKYIKPTLQEIDKKIDMIR